MNQEIKELINIAKPGKLKNLKDIKPSIITGYISDYIERKGGKVRYNFSKRILMLYIPNEDTYKNIGYIPEEGVQALNKEQLTTLIELLKEL